MIFSVKDSLRQAVEAASGGLATVMYTKKGQPVFLRRIPRFNLEDIDPSLGTGPHPAFVVNGETKSEIWIGMYPGVISQGELVSVPGAVPTITTFANAAAAAQAAGPGFHLLTNAEFAAIMLLHWKQNDGQDVLRGNTQWGRSHEAPWETATRIDGGAPGVAGGNHLHLTGSGPLTWRHDGTAWGIADLVNPRQWVAGLRLVNGEIQISLTDEIWHAILPDGSLVAPGTATTLKFDVPLAANYNADGIASNLGSPILRTSRKSPPAGWDESAPDEDLAQSGFTNVNVDTGISVPAILRSLLILPPSGFKGRISVRPYGTRVATRGLWGSDGTSGAASLDLDRTASASRAARPAFIL